MSLDGEAERGAYGYLASVEDSDVLVMQSCTGELTDTVEGAERSSGMSRVGVKS